MLEHDVRSIRSPAARIWWGIVTRRDLVRAFARDDEATAAGAPCLLGGWIEHTESTTNDTAFDDSLDEPGTATAYSDRGTKACP